MDFETIPGVGEKTAAALSELDDPKRALKRGDVAALARAPGVTPGRAAQIARNAIRLEHGDPGGFLGTPRVREIHRELLSLLASRTVTTYAEHRLETFFPSTRRTRIEEVRSFTRSALEREPDPAVLSALEAVEPLEPPATVRVRDRCLATTDGEQYAAARETVPELSVELVEDERALSELARGYATVVALDERFAGISVDGDVRVEPDALEKPIEIVPERPLAFFAANRKRLRASIEVHRTASLDPPESVDLERLEAGLSRVTSDGDVAGDEELDRLTKAVDDLDTAVSTAESVANDRLRAAIRERDVTIEGADLLSLVERGAGVDSLLSRELADEYADAVAAARSHLVEALTLESDEEAVANRTFGDEPTFPVEADDAIVSRLREELKAARERRAARLKRDIATDLADQRAGAVRLVEAALELDVELAIARFATDYECTMPELVWQEPAEPAAGSGGEETGESGAQSDRHADIRSQTQIGFDIVDGRSPLLDESVEAVDPVTYGVSGVTLLSGVNSGGKTSTLDLVASVVILAHMGLPVPAEQARLARFDGLHYHAKTQGTLDAGAFESTLREFAALAEEGDGSLVLVDELESITEPGASAKIVAGILEALDDRDATAVFVSHLAAEIREAAAVTVAVDGIEAVGLVDGELEVNRSPVKDHLARSTPELIVEKLAAADEQQFYDRLLEKFD